MDLTMAHILRNCGSPNNGMVAQLFRTSGSKWTRSFNLSIDCANPVQTRDFYAALTGWEVREAYGCPALAAENGMLILFMGCDFEYIPPVWPEEPGKQQKQMHFNFQVDDLPSVVAEAIKLGDPEGHPFCLCRK